MSTAQTLPSSKELEEAVIASVLTDRSCYLLVADLLSAECFYEEKYGIIWTAIETSFNNSRPIDITSIIHAIRVSGNIEKIGGSTEILRITEKATSSSAIMHHAIMIKQMWMLREIIDKGVRMVRKAYTNGADPFTLMSEINGSFDSLTSSLEKSKDTSLNKQLRNAIEDIEQAAKNKNVVGKSTGFFPLDRLGTMENGELIILAARPGMGKTVLAMQIGMNVAEQYREEVEFFEMEMRHQQLWKREFSRRTQILHDDLRKGRLSEADWAKLNQTVSEISRLPISVHDGFKQSISYMRRKCMQKTSRGKKIGLILVDFIQLADTESTKKNANREEEVGMISRGLKGLAKEFDCPVIAISSLNRDAEKRANKVPELGDLRNSGSLESDADRVLLLYRPEYYDIKEDENGQSTEGVAVIIQPKYRNGQTGECKLHFDGTRISFSTPGVTLPLPF